MGKTCQNMPEKITEDLSQCMRNVWNICHNICQNTCPSAFQKVCQNARREMFRILYMSEEKSVNSFQNIYHICRTDFIWLHLSSTSFCFHVILVAREHWSKVIVVSHTDLFNRPSEADNAIHTLPLGHWSLERLQTIEQLNKHRYVMICAYIYIYIVCYHLRISDPSCWHGTYFWWRSKTALRCHAGANQLFNWKKLGKANKLSQYCVKDVANGLRRCIGKYVLLGTLLALKPFTQCCIRVACALEMQNPLAQWDSIMGEARFLRMRKVEGVGVRIAEPGRD